MNIFEDLCGMSTLGSLEVDPQTLLQCTQTSLGLAKELTRRLRDSFAAKDNYPLLDFSLALAAKNAPLPAAIDQANQRTAQNFLDEVFAKGDFGVAEVGEDEVLDKEVVE